MVDRDPKNAWRILLIWIFANFLGVGVIGVISWIPFLTSIRGILVSSLLIGIPIGFFQWLAIRRIAPISFLWIFTISAGLLLGIHSPISGIWGFLDDESVLSLTAICTMIGVIVGLAQWLILHGHFAKSLTWLLSSAAGIGLGIGLVLATNLIDQGLVAIILVTLVYSIATGLAISWMPVLHIRIEGNPANAM
jgi:hypothetical protein